MPSKRINFKDVRANADFGKVLATYDIELQRDGSNPDQSKALCPFHDDTKPSMKVHTAKNVYKCFACDVGGNVLDFVMAMDGIEIRPAALKVAEICGLIEPAAVKTGTKKPAKSSRPTDPLPASPETPAALADPAEPANGDGEPYNPPLNFELKLKEDDGLLAWLDEHGIEGIGREAFGLGRASQRSKTIADRLAIPLHDTQGRLIGYSGRYLGDASEDDVPKYILPKGFRKELELFNYHRIGKPVRALVLFESYLSVMRHHRQFQTVSTFGRSISPQQVDLVAALSPQRIFVVADGDEPGRAGAREVAGALSEITWARAVDLPDGVKPHHRGSEEMADILRPLW